MAPSSTKELVLVGGGHSHVQVLRAFMMERPAGARLTLVVDQPVAIYSGMVPGYVAGQYRAKELEIDVVPLARRAGARVILSPALSIDAERRRIEVEGRAPVAYDLASIDIGSTVAGLDTPGVREHALPTRPISRLVGRLPEVAERLRERPGPVVVVGGGAGGVELAFTLHQRLIEAGVGPPRTILVHGGPRLVEGYPRRLSRRLEAEAEARGIERLLGRKVVAAEAGSVHLDDGSTLPCGALVWVTGAVSHPVFARSGLPTDDRGFVWTRPTLQVRGHDELFAVGDCATLEEHPATPKAGVYAVRQGPVLTRNLRAALAGEKLESYEPQSDFLTLLNLGDGEALGTKRGLVFGGRWVMGLKDWIDRRFMRRFQVLDAGGREAPEFADGAVMDDADPMLCGGCAAKVGQTVLERALGRLDPAGEAPSVIVGLADADDAAVVRTPAGDDVALTVDLFKAFTDDPWTVGRVAAVNALSDLEVKGVEARWAQALVTIPEAAGETEAEETLFQVLAGARAAFDELGVALVGGHTTSGSELAVGFAVQGTTADASDLLTHDRLRPDRALILTKPLGTGVLFHADMQGRARGPWLAVALEVMTRPNRGDVEVARRAGARAATDVTGFGLVGHLGAMLRSSGVGATLSLAALPALPGALELLALGLRSTFHEENARALKGLAIAPEAVDDPRLALLFDPQTSGGILFDAAAERAAETVRSLVAAGATGAAVIGSTGARRADGALLEVRSELPGQGPPTPLSAPGEPPVAD